MEKQTVTTIKRAPAIEGEWVEGYCYEAAERINLLTDACIEALRWAETNCSPSDHPLISYLRKTLRKTNGIQ